MTAKAPPLSLRSRIEMHGINPCILIKPGQAALLRPDWRGPMPVRVQVNDKPEIPWRINLMPRRDGGFRLYLAQTVRDASRTRVGELVDVRIQFDTEYRGGPMHPVPGWFSKRLQRNRKARTGWEQLPPSRKKEILRYFAQLKSPEAQARNAARAIHVLAGARARFMARDWNGPAHKHQHG